MKGQDSERFGWVNVDTVLTTDKALKNPFVRNGHCFEKRLCESRTVLDLNTNCT